MVLTLALTALAWAILAFLGYRCSAHRAWRPVYAMLFLLSGLNALAYTHITDDSAAYFTYRSWWLADLTPSLSGPLVGLCIRRRTGLADLVTIALLLCGAALFLVVPWIKPLLQPLDASRLRDHWQDGVCLQSSPSTCGPSALATLLRRHGIARSEAEIAVACHTSQTGTESWYLARYARRLGLQAEYRFDRTAFFPDSVIGIRLGQSGHFVAVFSATTVQVDGGDPLRGTATWTPDRLREKYGFAGLSLQIRRR